MVLLVRVLQVATNKCGCCSCTVQREVFEAIGPWSVSTFRMVDIVRYNVPLQLPRLAVDLLSRLLVVDQLKRITIPQIRQHEWFVKDLPAYLQQSPEQQESDEEFDPEVWWWAQTMHAKETSLRPPAPFPSDASAVGVGVKNRMRCDARLVSALVPPGAADHACWMPRGNTDGHELSRDRAGLQSSTAGSASTSCSGRPCRPHACDAATPHPGQASTTTSGTEIFFCVFISYSHSCFIFEGSPSSRWLSS